MEQHKINNTSIMGIPEKEREKSLFKEIIIGNSLKLRERNEHPFSGSLKVQNILNPKQTTLRHIIIKPSKSKTERILKASRDSE